jgi:hypothetical protein
MRFDLNWPLLPPFVKEDWGGFGFGQGKVKSKSPSIPLFERGKQLLPRIWAKPFNEKGRIDFGEGVDESGPCCHSEKHSDEESAFLLRAT